MSTGSNREYAIRDQLRKLGYFVCRGPGSRGIDLFAVPKDADMTLPCVAVEVGGKSKRLRAAFEKLLADGPPSGTVLIVARCEYRRWWFYYKSWPSETPTSRRDLRAAIEAAARETK